MTFFSSLIILQILVLVWVTERHLNVGFMIPVIKEARLSRLSSFSHDLILDVEEERVKLNALKPAELINLAQQTASIQQNLLPEHVDLEEVKDNLLYHQLIKLTRIQLKQIAKLYHIDLRRKSAFLCERIIEESRKASLPSTKSMKSTSASSASTELTLDEESEAALKEQGLDLQDLLQLQVQFQQKGPEIFLKGKSYPSKKRYASSEERRRESLRGGPKNTAASARRDELVRQVFEEDEGFKRDIPARVSQAVTKQDPLVLSDDELPTLPRRKSNKDTPDLGKILTAPKSDLLHGVTLEQIVEELVKKVGVEGLYQETRLRFLLGEPKLPGILKLLRNKNMEWARRKIEKLYVKVKSSERNDRSRR
eukprot:gene9913-10770_t